MKGFVTIIIISWMLFSGFGTIPSIDNIETDYDTFDSKSTPKTRGNTLYVGSDQTYTTIQSAVTAANSGDTIRVYNGFYYEEITIDKQVTMIGNGSANTWINSTSKLKDAVTINANGTIIDGFRIGAGSTGVRINSENNTITNCTITYNYGCGINISYAVKNDINNCDISNNQYGIGMWYSNNNTVFKNTIKSNTRFGIILEFSKDNEIYYNTIQSNTIYGVTIGYSLCLNKYYNLVYLNSFISNYQTGKQAANYYTKSRWNITGIGNYWSDWLTPDADKNGIVDNPYQLVGDPNCKDFYPLTTKPVLNKPIIYTPNIITAMEGKYYSNNYSAYDYDTPKASLTWTMTTNASWLNFNSSSLELYGTPAKIDIGNYWVKIKTTDGTLSDANNFTVKVHPFSSSQPPLITTTDIETAFVGYYYSVNYTATDPDTPQSNLTWSMKTNATFLTFSGTQELYGTPNASNLGKYWVNINVSDGNNSDSHNFSLTVKFKPQPPKITTTDVKKAYAGYYYSVNYTASDPDTSSGNLIWSWNTNASWLNFNASKPELYGTPSSGDTGTYWVFIKVSDGTYSDSTNFTVKVIKKPVSKSPHITTTDITTAYVGYYYSVYYNASDPDTPVGNLTWTWNTDASWLSFSSNHTLYGTPSSSDIGTYWVFIKVSDGVYSDSTNFTLNVTTKPGAKPPKITTTDVTVSYAGKYYSVNYTATDADTAQKKLTWSMSTNASWLSFSSSQELYGTPSSSDVGLNWVYISVSDGSLSDHTNFTLTVYAKGKVIIVRTGERYAKIQDAVDKALSGDTIRVYAGVYYENVQIEKTLTIIGNGSANTTINGGKNGNVVFISADYVNISGFMITGSSTNWNNQDAGIKAYGANYVTIKNNYCTGNLIGIVIGSADRNIIENNTCNSNPKGGIRIIKGSDRNVIKYNEAKSNQAGIVLIFSSTYNKVHNNIANSNDPYHGINLDNGCKYNIIYNNTANSNTDEGIYLYNNCDYNTITYNTVKSNKDHGIILQNGCDNNKIYLNNIIKNNYQALDDASSNKWDDGTGLGNYWSDWTTPDTNSDGIVDKPYKIDSNSKDNYPLTKMVGSGPLPKYKPVPKAPSAKSSSVGPNSTNVSVDTSKITITFDESMNTSSVEDALSINPSVNYSISWSDNDTVLIITINEKLAYNTKYTITINKNAKDKDGDNLASDVTVTFTTQLAGKMGDDDKGTSLNLGLITAIIVVIVIVMIIIFAVIYKNRKKKTEMMDLPEQDLSKNYEILRTTTGEGTYVDWEVEPDQNGSGELVDRIFKEVLEQKKAGVRAPAKYKILNKVESKYNKGEISKDTYDLIRERLI